MIQEITKEILVDAMFSYIDGTPQRFNDYINIYHTLLCLLLNYKLVNVHSMLYGEYFKIDEYDHRFTYEELREVSIFIFDNSLYNKTIEENFILWKLTNEPK